MTIVSLTRVTGFRWFREGSRSTGNAGCLSCCARSFLSRRERAGVRGFLSGALRCSAWIERAAHPAPAALQHVRVDHGRFDVLVPQEFLHRPNVVTVL